MKAAGSAVAVTQSSESGFGSTFAAGTVTYSASPPWEVLSDDAVVVAHRVLTIETVLTVPTGNAAIHHHLITEALLGHVLPDGVDGTDDISTSAFGEIIVFLGMADPCEHVESIEATGFDPNPNFVRFRFGGVHRNDLNRLFCWSLVSNVPCTHTTTLRWEFIRCFVEGVPPFTKLRESRSIWQKF